MKGGGNKNTFPASRNVSSEQQSASARERIFYNKVADHLQILTRAVAIVKKCRDLGIGCGGFFRPGYRDECRSFDNAVPPEIPKEFRKLVDGALHVSRDFLHQSVIDAEEVSIMSPNVCIVNFYNDSGRLGLHQDRDESKERLEKGLPVVSFSIGNSTEFLYSDVRDVDSAEKVILESGDVLIFGGKSRHIFHGVSCIKPKTAPQLLNDDANLRPGRLNLTFRQY
ncbi:hypothetical protein HPP92_012250 [Vanilla planifolia]|uniref:Fe2OG dioxygenase domain-containing protein n=2 Tax=Vanilla planifolia TaxID=51239 RepID=A0A835V5U2_VANPL|nr:hypothetical protein HPP92_012250 [Vanilla planifolia]